MKKLFYPLFLYLLAIISFELSAQNNKGINYQAAISDPNPIEIAGKSISGLPLIKANVCLKFEIINKSGAVDYTETQSTQTDEFGLVNLIIGIGKNTSNSVVSVGAGTYKTFDAIKWDENLKSLRVSLSLTNCSNFKEIALQTFNYLPYSFYAAYAGGVDYKNVADAPTKLSAFINDSGYLLPKDLDSLKETTKNLHTQIVNNFNITNQNIRVVKYAIDSSNAGIKIKIDELFGNIYNLSNRQNEQKNYIDNLFANIGQINNSINQLNNSVYQLNQSGGSYEQLANKSTNITTDATSDTKYPSVKAVKTYVDGQLSTVTIPDASTTSRGAVNTGQQTFAGNKSFTGNIFFNGLTTIADASITGSADLLGPLFLRGSAGSAGQILTSNGAFSPPSWTSLASVGGATFTVATPLAYANNVFSITAADANTSGYISNGTQTIGGAKTFTNDLIIRGMRIGQGTNTSNNFNIAIGGGWVNSTGDYNTWIGAGAATIQQSGNYNTVLGAYGLSYLRAGDNNIAIGAYQNVGPYSGYTNSNALNIGGLIFGKGMSGNWETPAGLLGIGKTNPTVRLDVAGSIKASDTLTASTIIKSGGTANQILAANGSVITAGTGVTISNGVISSTATNNADTTIINDKLSNKLNVSDTTALAAKFVRLTGNQTIAGNKSFTGTVSGISKTMVGLSNVDNTSDVNKPVSAATQTALNNKLGLIDTTKSVRLVGNQTIKGNKTFTDTTALSVANITSKLLLSGAAGTSGQVLSVNSSGNLVWTTPVTNSGGGTSSITSVSSPLVLSSGTLSMEQADSTKAGYLTGADWKTFYKKLSAADTVRLANRVSTKLTASDTTALVAKFVRLTGNQTIAGNKSFTGTVSGISKTMVGLSNVDNTSDINKPVSTATQTALDLKLNKADTTIINDKLRKKLNESDTTALAAKFVRLAGNQTINGKKTFSDTIRLNTANILGKLLLGGSAGNSGQLLGIGSSGELVWTTPVTNSGGGSSNITSVTSPLALSSGTLSITQANDSNAGYLSSADFTSFKNKLSASDTASLSARIDKRELVSNKSTDVNLGSSDTLYPSQKAVKTYVDNAVAIPDASNTLRGLMNTTGQTFEGKKEFLSGIVAKGSGTQASVLNSTIIPLLVLGEGRNPTKIFEVQNNSHVAAVINTNTNGVTFAGIQLQRVGIGQWDIGINGNNQIINGIVTHRNDLIFNSIGGHVVGINGFTGNMGIGNNNAQQKLDVSGGIRFNGVLSIGDTVGTAGQALVSQGPGLAPRWKTIQANIDTTSLVNRINAKADTNTLANRFVRLTTNQTISGNKTFSDTTKLSTTNITGKLLLSGIAGSSGQVLSLNNLGNLVWTTPATNNGGSNLNITTVSSPLVLSSGTLSMEQADSTKAGYLTGADWKTFYKKLSAADTVRLANRVSSKLTASDTTALAAKFVRLTGNQTIAGNKSFTGTVSGISKTMVGLSNVDNTSDVNKPVSAATQTALNDKLGLIDTTKSVRLVGNQTIKGNKTFTDTTALSVANITSKLLLSGAAGTSGQVLSVNSSGNLVWTTPVTNSGGGTSSITSVSTPLDLTSGTLSMEQADSTKAGYLTGADWKTFYKKLSAADTVRLANRVSSKLTASDTTALAAKFVRLTGNQTIAGNKSFTGTVSGITKAMVGLSDVDNTGDLAKPISTATQTALDARELLANKSNDGNLGTSKILYPTQNAVKRYVDSLKALTLSSSDSTRFVRLIGNERIAGVKSFSNTPDMISGISFNKASGTSRWGARLSGDRTQFIIRSDSATAGLAGGISIGLNGTLLAYGGSSPFNASQAATLATGSLLATEGNMIAQGSIRANNHVLGLKNVVATDTLVAGKGIKLQAGTASQFLLANGTLATVGSGLSLSSGVLSAVVTALPSATTSSTGVIQLAGDLGNTATTPRIVALQGTSLSSTAPTNNQVLKYNGTAWAPANSPRIETEEYTATAGQTTFTLTNTPSGRVQIFRNGVRLPKDSITISGTTITYIPANNSNDILIGGDTITIDYIY